MQLFQEHEQVVVCHEPEAGLRAIIAVHDTTLGPSLGGIRMWRYPSDEAALTDVLRLARGMTYKNAAAGLDLGGGKTVVLGDPRTEKCELMFRALGRFIDSLGGLWSQGKLADKVYAGFTSSQTPHGGQETTLLSLYISLMHFGGIIVPPGYTDPIKFADGNPYGVSHITGPDNQTQVAEPTAAALTHLAHRVVAIAARLAT